MNHATVVYKGKRLSFEKAVRQARELIENQHYAEAEPLARAIVAVAPDFDAGLQMLGTALGEQGHYEEAVKYCEAAVKLHPSSPHLKNSLANYLANTVELERAEALYREALVLAPGLPDATYNLGKLLIKLERYAEAEQYLQQAVQMAAGDANAYRTLGVCLYQAGNYHQAALWFQLAHSAEPDNAEIVYNIGTCLQETGKHEEAIVEYEKALQLDPNMYHALIRLATSHFFRQRLSVAKEYAEAYLEHCPDTPDKDDLNAMMMLSGISKSRGDQQGAIEIEQKIIEKHPEINVNFSNMLLDMVYSDQHSQEELFSWCQKFAEYYERPLLSQQPKHTNEPDPERKLRIGYVSADFFNHSVSYFALPLIAKHDREKFEVFTYAVRNMPSFVGEQYKKFSHWSPVVGLSEESVAKRIQEDKIDILIDLSGHTGGNQLLAFARKPAPVQATWLGFPFSTGLTSIDYRIVDEYVQPRGSERLSSETLIRIPGMFCAYRPSISFPDRLLTGELDVRPTPALAAGYVTFGTCNNIAKLTDFTLQLWARVLNMVPTSKLLIEAVDVDTEQTRQGIAARFEKNGIPMSRVILSDRAKNRQYNLYHSIDIALDPFPCNGGTTTCDALFMSVPVVSLSGDRFTSRMGLTMLTNCGHPEWVTDSPDEYVKIAADLASDIQRLNHIRQNLRTEAEHSNIMDEVGFARKMERAYREMWYVWCAKQRGEHYEPRFEELGASNVQPSGLESVETTYYHALDTIYDKGNWVDLLAQCQEFLTDHPNDEYVESLRVEALLGLQQLTEAHEHASALFERAAESSYAQAALGRTLCKTSPADAAAREMLEKALTANPRLIQARHALAETLIQQGRLLGLASPEANQLFHQATNQLQQAVEMRPKNVASWLTLANLQIYRNRHNEAEVSILRVLKQVPQHPEASLLLAQLLMKRQECQRAEDLLKPLLANAKQAGRAHAALGKLYSVTGNPEKMMAHSQFALEVSTETDCLEQWFWHANRSGLATPETFASWTHEYQKRVQPDQETMQHLNPPDPARKLHIGVVSGSLYENEYIYSTLALLTLLNRANHKLFFYYNGEVYDNFTHHLESRVADEWHFTRGIPASEVARQVQNDQIDILIELDGHQPCNLVQLFAHHPAPVQLRWSGYPDTTALNEVEYLITDEVLTPEGNLPATYKETAISLDGHAFILYEPLAFHPECASMTPYQLQPPPSQYNGHITFGCWTPGHALTESTLSLWAQALHAVPDSVLVISHTSTTVAVTEGLKKHGIHHARIKKIDWKHRPMPELFYQNVDICLDTAPHNQLHSSLHALWMGVPVVTLKGETPNSRIGASILTHLGREAWIAQNDAEYVNIIKGLTDTPAALEEVRQTLRGEVEQSSLTNKISYTKAFEKALRRMWSTWCASDAALMAHDHWRHQESLQLCQQIMQSGDYAQAWQAYKAVLQQWPTCPESMHAMGMIAMLNADAHSAIALLERAVQICMEHQDPLLADSLATLGNAYLTQNQIAHARHCFQHSLALKESTQVQEWLNALPNECSTIH